MKLSKNRVTAIWAEHESTRAIGYKNRLPWKKCQLDLDILTGVISNMDRLVVTRNTYADLPMSFISKHNLDVVSSEYPIEEYLSSVEKSNILVLGGRLLYQHCIDNNLLNSIIVNTISFADDITIEYDTTAPLISDNYKIIGQRQISDSSCSIITSIYGK